MGLKAVSATEVKLVAATTQAPACAAQLISPFWLLMAVWTNSDTVNAPVLFACAVAPPPPGNPLELQ